MMPKLAMFFSIIYYFIERITKIPSIVKEWMSIDSNEINDI